MAAIQESTEYSSSSRPPPTRGTRRSMAWPFHHSRSGNSRSGHSRSGSEAASTTFSTFSNFRWANWQHRSFLRMTPEDATSSISQSIVPDYIVNYLRGETPETLAQKREQRAQMGEHHPAITPNEDPHSSFPVEFGHYYSSSTDLTRGLNGGSGSRHSGFRRHFSGWRGGVVFNSLVSLIILVAEIIVLVIILTKTKLLAGESAVWSGDCARAERINIGIHVVINAIGIVLLAGANYVFQVLSSPTRREVDKAHEKRRWLDIGVTSVRNFAHISGFRAILGIIILFTAIAIQVIYNAVIYVTQGGSESESVNESGRLVTTTNNDVSCSLNINGPLYGIVMLLNLALLLGTTAAVLVRGKTGARTGSGPSAFEPLATVGDALRSFLREPDRTTAGACLLTKDDVQRGHWGQTREQAMAFVPRTHLWLHTPSLARWSLTALAWLAACGPAAVGLALLLTTIVPRHSDTESESAQRFPVFGMPYANLLSPAQPVPAAGPPGPVARRSIDDAAVRTALIAALPQLVLAVLYLAANALLTTFFLGQEYALYAAAAPVSKAQRHAEFNPPRRLQPRPLRVSASPAGQQVTSLFLTLPRPVSWVLLAAFAALGFLASQAVAPVVYMNMPEDPSSGTTNLSADSSRPSSPPTSADSPTVAIALNTTALLATVGILALLALLTMSLGLRRAPDAPLVNAYADENGNGNEKKHGSGGRRELRGNPLAQALRGGSCSAVFSAACHAPRGEYGSSRGCVAWGALADSVVNPPQPQWQRAQPPPPRPQQITTPIPRRSSTPLSPLALARSMSPSPSPLSMSYSPGPDPGLSPGPSPGPQQPFIPYNDGLNNSSSDGGDVAMVGRCAFSGNVSIIRGPSATSEERGPMTYGGLGFVDLERRYA